MDNRYVNIMEDGINNKTVLLQFVNYNMPIVDVGSSTGALTFELATEAHKTGVKVFSLEPDKETFEQLEHNVETFDNVYPKNVSLEDWLGFAKMNLSAHNIVLSSIVHHMGQYREMLIDKLYDLFKDLPKGTRVLIRDGVRPSRKRDKEVIGLVCNPRSLELAKEFFKRWNEWHSPIDGSNYHIDGCTVWAPRWLLIEMLLTITWGKESMKRECYEHYTILGIEDYIEIFEGLEYETLYAESIIQPGYYEFLPKLGKLINEKGYEIPLPFTNQILAFEKK